MAGALGWPYSVAAFSGAHDQRRLCGGAQDGFTKACKRGRVKGGSVDACTVFVPCGVLLLLGCKIMPRWVYLYTHMR